MTIPEYNTERRSLPKDSKLLQEAKKHPGGWVYEVDWPYRDDHRVPPEAIRGSWKVDVHGQLTGEYLKNNRFRPIEETDREPPAYMHEAGKHLSDEWMVEMDPSAEHLFPDIPEDKIVGWWYVDSDGKLTRTFRPNSR